MGLDVIIFLFETYSFILFLRFSKLTKLQNISVFKIIQKIFILLTWENQNLLSCKYVSSIDFVYIIFLCSIINLKYHKIF